MSRRSALMVGSILLALTLTGCASAASLGAVGTGGASPEPAASSRPNLTSTSEAVAQKQAQKWLDAAELPRGAVRADENVASFGSYTAWPCGPYVQLEGFWKVPGATVTDTGNWLRQHPPARLVTTYPGPLPADPTLDSAIVGFVPSEGAQEGIVFTMQRVSGGVAVRAEVAARATSAACAPPVGGGEWGAPGLG